MSLSSHGDRWITNILSKISSSMKSMYREGVQDLLDKASRGEGDGFAFSAPLVPEGTFSNFHHHWAQSLAVQARQSHEVWKALSKMSIPPALHSFVCERCGESSHSQEGCITLVCFLGWIARCVGPLKTTTMF